MVRSLLRVNFVALNEGADKKGFTLLEKPYDSAGTPIKLELHVPSELTSWYSAMA